MRYCYNLKITEQETMAYFITSDLHFGHHNILKYNAKTRPFSSIEEMDEALIQHWNSVVSPKDTVYNLGDITFYHNFEKVKNILNRLNGKHILIFGNHDYIIRANLDFLLKNKKADGNFFLESAQEYLAIKHNGLPVILFHYPIFEWDRMHHGSIHLYGHLHDKTTPFDNKMRMLNVGFDNLTHIARLDEVVDKLKELPITPRGEQLQGSL